MERACKVRKIGSVEQDRPLEYFAAASRTDALEYDVVIAPHPPELYRASSAGKPLNYNVVEKGGLEAVKEEHVQAYGKQGYLVVEDMLSEADVQRTLAALQEVVMCPTFQAAAARTSAAQAKGEIDLANGGCNPVLQFEAFAKDVPSDNLYSIKNVRKLMGFHECNAYLAEFANNEAVRRVASKLLEEAGCSKQEASELDVFQSLALLKPPGGREKPWHQDNSYFNVDSARVKMVGLWVALSEVRAENGAMHVLPAPLDELQPITHWNRRDWQICDTDILKMQSRDAHSGGSGTSPRDCVAIPLEPGGALFFSTMLPHGTPTNASDVPRYAVQFHFIPKCFSARTGTQERKAVWGEEASPGAAC
eukprot:TRINITY_DN66721_c0_g1_i1.p1 TRINITY_DN66721_c0_g1~~TRINITY_DN66721_c0_g1_i1.p1  ORF type:complete len:364 (-),score=34.06 TRINITY_DN66721_c0_g1_i1:72-1163(-)